MPRFADRIRGAAVPEVVREVADHLVLKEAVREDAIEKAFASGALPKDAGEALSCLERAGAVTASQVYLLQTSFADAQRERMRAMLSKAIAAGLIAESAREYGMTEFEGAILRETPIEFLVSRGAVTAAQAQTLAEVAPASPTSGLSFLRDRKFRQAVAMGAAASLLVFVSLEVAAWLNDWEALGLGMAKVPIMAAPFVIAGVRARLLGRWAVVAALVGTVIASVASVFVVAAIDTVARPKLIIEPSCTMNGNGLGRCVFANPHERPASGCGRVVATCSRRGGVPESRETGTLCSGDVRPHYELGRSFELVEFDQIRDHVVPPFGDWRNFCSFTWVPVEQ